MSVIKHLIIKTNRISTVRRLSIVITDCKYIKYCTLIIRCLKIWLTRSVVDNPHDLQFSLPIVKIMSYRMC